MRYELIDPRVNGPRLYREIRNRRLTCCSLTSLVVLVVIWWSSSYTNQGDASFADFALSDAVDDYTEASDDVVIADARNHSLTLSKRESIWDMTLPLPKPPSRHDQSHPHLAFVKGLKVGGTSVAFALNQVAKAYNIRFARETEGHNRQPNFDVIGCSNQGWQLFFHHGYRNPWQERCITDVRFTTVLREPVDQALSWETMSLNRLYYLEYPTKKCRGHRRAIIEDGEIDLMSKLHSTQKCRDTPLRQNATLMLVAQRVRRFHESKKRPGLGHPGMAVSLTANWITSSFRYNRISSKEFIEILKTQYFLVGISERMNEYLVLLAEANGWDLKYLYYRKCKPTDLHVHKEEFRRYYPELVEKLERIAKPSIDAYEWAKMQFDEHVKSLGDWFPKRVEEFERGLAEFQAKSRRDKKEAYLWKQIRYVDGHSEFC